MKIIDWLQARSKRQIVSLGAVLILLIGGADYVSGSELSFSVFYLIPVVILAWFADRRAGIRASAASAVLWFLADHFGGRVYSSPLIPFWNAAVRLGFFLIVTFMVSWLYAAQARREELGHFVVHDLRSPLSNVLGSLHFLREISGDTLDADQQKLVGLAVASSNRMMTLINSLLDLSKLESGKMQLNQQTMPVAELFDKAVQQLAALAARSDVQIASQIAESAQTVLADSEVTVRVLVNLLSNAIKYSPEAATVALRAAPHTQGMIAISVTDSGQGIPKEWTDKVFDKFIQVQSKQAGVGAGSGLGLTFCRLAVEAQGGRIWLESEVGRGSTFTFTLPRGQ